MKYIYKNSIFKKGQYCFTKKYYFEYLVSVWNYMEEKVTDMNAIRINRFRTPIFEVNRLSYLTSIKEQQRHICNKSLHIKGIRESIRKVLCLQKFQEQSLYTPALYKISSRLVGARKRVRDMNEEQRKKYEEEKARKRKKYIENKEERLTKTKKHY